MLTMHSRPITAEESAKLLPNCHQCGNAETTMFILKKEVWLGIARMDERLCPRCAELRLGRPLVFSDLSLKATHTNAMILGARVYLNSSPEEQATMRELFGSVLSSDKPCVPQKLVYECESIDPK